MLYDGMNRGIRRLAPICVLLSAIAAPASADPPPQTPFPVPAPRVFCFRITDIEGDPADANTFTIQFEFLNWTNQPAFGTYIWVNAGTSARIGAPPTLMDAGVDGDGRGGPPGGQDIGSGIYNSPAHQSGRGRGDIPGHLNDWSVVFRGPTSLVWGDVAFGNTPIPFRSLLTAASSAAQFALVPGLGDDGLLTPDSAIDGGPLPYGPPTQPAPFPTGGQPVPDGSGNVLDGFWIRVTDFHEGEVLSMNWMLLDAAGASIGQVGASGNTVGNAMGFGLFNLARIPLGDALPPGVFEGNSGFTQGVNFYPGSHLVPDAGGPGSPAEFGVEFGAALLAPPLSPNVATEVPAPIATLGIVPNIDPGVIPPNAVLQTCGSNPADVNASGAVNVADAQCLLLTSAWQMAGGSGQAPACLAIPLAEADLNCDGGINVGDVQIVVYVALGAMLPQAVDGNGNQCPDACECSTASCDDGDACTSDQCDTSGQCVHLPFGCDDGDPCTDDACSTASGCTHALVDCAGTAECPSLQGRPCDDGDACTAGDACDAGSCTGATANCDDGDPCTLDTCQSAVGCTSAPMADGEPCGGSDICIQGHCLDAQPCTTHGDCAGLNGDCVTYTCAAPPALGGATICVVSSSQPCDDGNPCTLDECVAGTGCEFTPWDAAPCDDGDDCNLLDGCLAGQCVGLGERCDDGNPCSVDFCAPDASCWATPLDGPVCNDADACTTGEVCQLGHCLGAPVDCDDSDACTANSCTPASGCAHPPIPCDDLNPCTDDTCNVATGCEFTPNTDPCDDGDPETSGDVCTDGVCEGTAEPPVEVGGPAIVAYSNFNGLRSVNIDGSVNTTFVPTGAQIAEWSPDGTKVAYRTFSPAVEIWVQNAAGGAALRLSPAGSSTQKFTWSKDSTHVVFEVIASGFLDLYSAAADGSSLVNLTNTPSASENEPVFSPDGSKIAYRNASAGHQIWTMNADGTGKAMLINTFAGELILSHPIWSPDGAHIYVFGGFTGNLYRFDANGTNRVTIGGGAVSFGEYSIAPDGSAIAFLRNNQVHVVRNPQGPSPTVHQLTTPTSGNGSAYQITTWSADGTKVIFDCNSGGSSSGNRLCFIDATLTTPAMPTFIGTDAGQYPHWSGFHPSRG